MYIYTYLPMQACMHIQTETGTQRHMHAHAHKQKQKTDMHMVHACTLSHKQTLFTKS